MQALRIPLDRRVLRRVHRLKSEAEATGEHCTARRFRAIALNMEGRSGPDIARILHVHRSNVLRWTRSWMSSDAEGLFEGHRPGRPPRLSEEDLEHLATIVDSGPVAYGLTTSVWTAPILAHVIGEEFGVEYTPRQVQRILHKLGFTV